MDSPDVGKGLVVARGSGQAAKEPQRLAAGKPVEREITGGQSHTYQITLQAGQFSRLVVDQKAIDVALTRAAPDGGRLMEANLTGRG
jgi:hypothetical protein